MNDPKVTVPVSQTGWNCRFRRALQSAIAEEAALQPHQGLAGPSIGFPGGIGHRIDQPVVDSFQARRVGIAEPRHLHRRRLAGKYAKPVFRRMAGEIDQDIDAVRPDTLGKLIVRQPDGHQPVIGKFLQTRRNHVRPQYLGIAEYFHRLPIVSLQQRLDKIRH